MDIELSPESAGWASSLDAEKRRVIRELHRLRPARNLVALVFAALWAGAGWTVLNSGLLPVRVTGIVLMGGVIHALAILMHEGVHGNLFRNETLDRWTGFLLGAPALFSCSAYRVNHMLHHAFNRGERDPDEFTNLSRNRKALSLAFYAWLVVGMAAYLVHVPFNALRRGSRKQRARVLLELGLMAGFYAAILFTSWQTGMMEGVLVCWVWPMAAASVFGAVRGWAEHMLTRPGHPLTQSRTVTSNALVSFFMCNLNYHLEHHLFPGVPWYNLPRVHRLLVGEYARAGSFIYSSYLRFLWDAVREGVHGEAPRRPVQTLLDLKSGVGRARLPRRLR
jgi:fatty acid desaturase